MSDFESTFKSGFCPNCGLSVFGGDRLCLKCFMKFTYWKNEKEEDETERRFGVYILQGNDIEAEGQRLQEHFKEALYQYQVKNFMKQNLEGNDTHSINAVMQ